MTSHTKLTLLVGLATALGGGCEADTSAPYDSGFQRVVVGEREILEVEGRFGWFRNSLDNTDYQGWSTNYPNDGWIQASTDAHLTLEEADGIGFLAELTLPQNHSLSFSLVELGLGWRASYPTSGDIRDFDLEALGVAPQGEQYAGIDFTKCQVEDARVLAALSSFPGTEEEVWEMARVSATAQNRPIPETWYQMVTDPQIYDFLFGEHRTHTAGKATFAFVGVQINPLCGDLRMALHIEDQLVGPITH